MAFYADKKADDTKTETQPLLHHDSPADVSDDDVLQATLARRSQDGEFGSESFFESYSGKNADVAKAAEKDGEHEHRNNDKADYLSAQQDDLENITKSQTPEEVEASTQNFAEKVGHDFVASYNTGADPRIESETVLAELDNKIEDVPTLGGDKLGSDVTAHDDVKLNVESADELSAPLDAKDPDHSVRTGSSVGDYDLVEKREVPSPAQADDSRTLSDKQSDGSYEVVTMPASTSPQELAVPEDDRESHSSFDVVDAYGSDHEVAQDAEVATSEFLQNHTLVVAADVREDQEVIDEEPARDDNQKVPNQAVLAELKDGKVAQDAEIADSKFLQDHTLVVAAHVREDQEVIDEEPAQDDDQKASNRAIVAELKEAQEPAKVIESEEGNAPPSAEKESNDVPGNVVEEPVSSSVPAIPADQSTIPKDEGEAYELAESSHLLPTQTSESVDRKISLPACDDVADSAEHSVPDQKMDADDEHVGTETVEIPESTVAEDTIVVPSVVDDSRVVADDGANNAVQRATEGDAIPPLSEEAVHDDLLADYYSQDAVPAEITESADFAAVPVASREIEVTDAEKDDAPGTVSRLDESLAEATAPASTDAESPTSPGENDASVSTAEATEASEEPRSAARDISSLVNGSEAIPADHTEYALPKTEATDVTILAPARVELPIELNRAPHTVQPEFEATPVDPEDLPPVVDEMDASLPIPILGDSAAHATDVARDLPAFEPELEKQCIAPLKQDDSTVTADAETSVPVAILEESPAEPAEVTRDVVAIEPELEQTPFTLKEDDTAVVEETEQSTSAPATEELPVEVLSDIKQEDVAPVTDSALEVSPENHREAAVFGTEVESNIVAKTLEQPDIESTRDLQNGTDSIEPTEMEVPRDLPIQSAEEPKSSEEPDFHGLPLEHSEDLKSVEEPAFHALPIEHAEEPEEPAFRPLPMEHAEEPKFAEEAAFHALPIEHNEQPISVDEPAFHALPFEHAQETEESVELEDEPASHALPVEDAAEPQSAEEPAFHALPIEHVEETDNTVESAEEPASHAVPIEQAEEASQSVATVKEPAFHALPVENLDETDRSAAAIILADTAEEQDSPLDPDDAAVPAIEDTVAPEALEKSFFTPVVEQDRSIVAVAALAAEETEAQALREAPVVEQQREISPIEQAAAPAAAVATPTETEEAITEVEQTRDVTPIVLETTASAAEETDENAPTKVSNDPSVETTHAVDQDRWTDAPKQHNAEVLPLTEISAAAAVESDAFVAPEALEESFVHLAAPEHVPEATEEEKLEESPVESKEAAAEAVTESEADRALEPPAEAKETEVTATPKASDVEATPREISLEATKEQESGDLPIEHKKADVPVTPEADASKPTSTSEGNKAAVTASETIHPTPPLTPPQRRHNGVSSVAHRISKSFERLISIASSPSKSPMSRTAAGGDVLPVSSITAAVRATNPILDEVLYSLNLISNNDESLTELDMSDCPVFSARHVSTLASALLTNTHLKTLNLKGVTMNTQNAEEIAEALIRNSTLEVLDLSHNFIAPAGIKALANMLEVNTTLKELRLAHQRAPAGTDAEQALARALRKNETITTLNLQIRDVASRNAILRCITRNKEIARKARLAAAQEQA
ncbi:hypothetical protein PhCBS80983_g05522 [Powellomyces hirtus]|uniref:Uncharacterized protein n=1 Tax=Powellomyces hirtus TaxID=109895 RepID=A0A507DTU8_9FUNG|nr:hypothetical protein PhCBS80983_g05522 [Powellomyces hirtus]